MPKRYIMSQDKLGNKYTFDTVEGSTSLNYYDENPILKSIIFNVSHVSNTIEDCIQFCIKQSQLESLIFFTDLEDICYSDIYDSPLNRLRFLFVACRYDIDNMEDYILPFIRNAPNLEYVFYLNGSLNNQSLRILSKMVKRNLCFMHLDTVHIQDQTFFRKVFKTFDTIFWLLRQRYMKSDLRDSNFLISAWKKIFRK